MRHRTAFRTLIVATAVLGVVVGLGSCGGKADPGAPSGGEFGDASSAARPPAQTDTSAAVAPGEDTVESDDSAAESTPGEALTAENIVGSTWQAGPLKLEFGEEGALTVNGEGGGTWSIAGDTLTVSANNLTYSAEIRQDKIFYGGMEVQRLN